MHVQVDSIDKSFGPTRVLKQCSLEIDRGEVVTLLGPSGCGKTTLLRCIAGFYLPEAGRVVIGGRDMTLVPPHRRDVGMIFQSYALFPHLDVRRNVEYGLSVRRVARAERDRRVAEALDLVSLGGLADRYPSQLSGGQQQRVAIARVLVLEPTVLLLDEPFNALDAKLRYSMQVELRKLVKTLGITTIFVTHDQSEALTLSDRVAVMREGELEQVAAPLGVYDTPASGYVADFIGSANAIAGEAREGRLEIAPGISLASRVEGRAVAIVRPENLRAEPVEGDTGDGWYGQVGFVRALGATVEYEIEVPEREAVRVLALRLASDRVLELGQRVRISLRDPEACPVLRTPAP